MKSAGNGGVVHDRLQVLHVHVFLAAPLSTCHMAKAGTDQHQGGVAVREHPHHAGPAEGETLLPHSASVMSSTRRTETPARYISMSASSTLLSRRRYRSMMAVSKDTPLSRGDMERDIAGGGGEIPVVVAAAVALTGLAALIAGGLRQRLRLLLQ